MSDNPVKRTIKEIIEERKELCKKCEFVLNYNDRLKRSMCGLCGCPLLRKIKSHCPARKW